MSQWIFIPTFTGRGIKLKLLGVKLQRRRTVNIRNTNHVHPAEYLLESRAKIQ